MAKDFMDLEATVKEAWDAEKTGKSILAALTGYVYCVRQYTNSELYEIGDNPMLDAHYFGLSKMRDYIWFGEKGGDYEIRLNSEGY